MSIETSEWERVEGSLLRAIQADAARGGRQPRLLLGLNRVRGLRIWNDGWVEDDERIKQERAMLENSMLEFLSTCVTATHTHSCFTWMT